MAVSHYIMKISYYVLRISHHVLIIPHQVLRIPHHVMRTPHCVFAVSYQIRNSLTVMKLWYYRNIEMYLFILTIFLEVSLFHLGFPGLNSNYLFFVLISINLKLSADFFFSFLENLYRLYVCHVFIRTKHVVNAGVTPNIKFHSKICKL